MIKDVIALPPVWLMEFNDCLIINFFFSNLVALCLDPYPGPLSKGREGKAISSRLGLGLPGLVHAGVVRQLWETGVGAFPQPHAELQELCFLRALFAVTVIDSALP